MERPEAAAEDTSLFPDGRHMVEHFQDVLSLTVGLEVQREVVGEDGTAQQDGLVQEERLGQNARDIGGGRRAIWAVDC